MPFLDLCGNCSPLDLPECEVDGPVVTDRGQEEAVDVGASTLGLESSFSMYCDVACSQAPNPCFQAFQIMVSPGTGHPCCKAA